MLSRDLFYQRVAVCKQCEHWRGVCVRGHTLNSHQPCPEGHFGLPTGSAPVLREIIERDDYALKPLAASGFVPCTIVDIGCSEGIFCYWAQQFWPHAALYAFDPYPCHDLLARNAPTAHVLTKAIFGFYGRTNLDFGDSGWKDTLDTRTMLHDRAVTATEAVRLCGLTSIDLLKIDCEGCEVNIFKEWAETGFLARIQCITGEWHGLRNRAALEALLVPHFEVKFQHRFACPWDAFQAIRRSPADQVIAALS